MITTISKVKPQVMKRKFTILKLLGFAFVGCCLLLFVSLKLMLILVFSVKTWMKFSFLNFLFLLPFPFLENTFGKDTIECYWQLMVFTCGLKM